MRKRNIIFIVFSVLLFVLLMFLESNRKEPLSWKQTFCGKDKIPYGTYVLKHLLADLYPENSVQENGEGIFMFHKVNPDIQRCKFLFITNYFSLDNELEELTHIIKNWNDVFIAAESFDSQLADSLDFSVKYKFTEILDSNRYTTIHFTNSAIDNEKGFRVNEALTGCYLSYKDTSHTAVLAVDADKNPIFIKIWHGNGDFYICSTPLLFTNYNILYGNSEYPFKALSYVRGHKFIWDEYYKPYKTEVETPVRYVLTQPALKAAYMLLMITVLIYIFFKGKRRQRIIPVIKPPQNLSLDYVTTVGRLYFSNGNNRDIAMKRYVHFCDYLRNKYNIKSIAIEPDFFNMLSQQSGVKLETVSVLFKLANHIHYQTWTSDEVLMSFNEKIEEFYMKTR